MVAAVAGESGNLAVARAYYFRALAAYDQALVEDSERHPDQVRVCLIQARKNFRRADVMLEGLRIAQADAEVDKLLVDVRRAGRPCCGRQSLWEKYPLAADQANESLAVEADKRIEQR